MTNSGERFVVVESDPDISDLISRQALKPLGLERLTRALERTIPPIVPPVETE